MSARPEYVVSSEAGEHLEAARRARGLSQHDLSRASGLRRRQIAAFERGTAEPSEQEWVALADGLGMPADDLVPPRQRLLVVTTGAGGELRGDAALDALLR
jgi:transcriptional regulator with XRE-family HTH domain